MIQTSVDAKVGLKDTVPTEVETVAVLLHKGSAAEAANLRLLGTKARAALEALLAAKAVTGKSNELTIQLLNESHPQRLAVVGLGNPARFSAQCLREAGATLAKAARKQKWGKLAVVVPQLPEQLPGLPGAAPLGPGVMVATEALATGFLLGAFEFKEYKGSASKKENGNSTDAQPLQLTIVLERSAPAKPALERALAVCEGQNFTRTIASRPGNAINPPVLARLAQQVARQAGLSCRVLDEQELKKLGMGGLLAVGGGSQLTPPRLIAIEYRPQAGKRKTSAKSPAPLLLVGKGITFDTGGISIKPADRMGRMIYDKSGAVIVLGTMLAVARLKPGIPVVGLMSCAENHISASAYRPGDVLKMYNGVTVEVTNTDAEGRLVLGDALAWGIETYRPAAVVDLATLTGAMVVALGKTMAGAMGNDPALIQELRQSADNAGEKLWPMPLFEEHKEQIKSDSADIINAAGRDAGSLTAAAFLSYFVPDTTPWAHLDIAGVADTDKDQALYAKGSTGWGVRTLLDWIERRAPK